MTALKDSYRAHPKILKLYNDIFYEKKLKATKEDKIDFKNTYKSILSNNDAPVLLIHAEGEDERDKDSPSFYNILEVNIIFDLILKLVCRDQVDPKEIAVLTP